MKNRNPNFAIILTLSSLLIGLESGIAISRIHDPIIIQGQNIPSFLGESVGSIRIFKYNGLQWEPILFQVDELDETNAYYGEKDGILSENDEVVFLSKDCGVQARANQWPDDIPARHSNRYEIQITDPINLGESAYAYIFLSSSMTQLNTAYFNINQEDDWVKTPTYTVWHEQHGFQGGLYLHKAAGGDSINIVERQKFRVIGKINAINEEIAILEEQDGNISLLGGLASIHAYVGPKDIQYLPGSKVRLHRYLELEYRFNGKVLTYNIDHKGSYKFLTTFYPTFAEWQSGELNITKISDINIREVRITTDLRSNAWGMLFYNPYNFDPPLKVDKTGDTYDDTIPWPGDSWHMIVANPDDPDKRVNQATLLTVTKIPTVPIYTQGHFYYKDSQSKVKHDTGDDKSWGDTGFQMTGNDINGPIDFYTATYYLPENLTYEQGEALSTQHLNPLEVELSSQLLTCSVTVDLNPEIGGSVSISPDITEHPAYSTVTVTAKPNPGYDFDFWIAHVASTKNPLIFEIQKDMLLIANFEPRMHEITILSNPMGLIVTVNGKEKTTPASFIWQEATTHMIEIDSTIYLNDNHRLVFRNWNSDNERHFQLTVKEASQFMATFGDQYLLTALPAEPFTGQVGMLSQDHWFDKDSMATIRAIPAVNYSFSHWSGDTTSNLSELNLFMDQPWSVIANFTNAPPIILAADTSMAEDDTLTLTLTDIERWVQDDNTPVSSLSFSFSGANHLITDYDAENVILKITPNHDWFGEDTLWISVADPVGALTQAPLTVTVLPTADYPSSFALLTPKQETDFSDWPTVIEFTWEAAIDPDLTDTITYTFELDTSSTFQSPVKIRIENIQWTQYILLWPNHLGNNTYFWRILAKDNTGLTTANESNFMLTLTTNVASTDALPKDFILEQNYPNPFNGSTTLRYGLPRDEHISVTIFNSQGQTVKNLWEGQQNAGYHTVLWHGRDNQGRSVSSGMYMIVLRTESRKWMKKALLLQ